MELAQQTVASQMVASQMSNSQRSFVPPIGYPVVWHPGANPAVSHPALVCNRSDLGLLTLVVFEPSRVRQIVGVPPLDRVESLNLSREDRARVGAWSLVPGFCPHCRDGACATNKEASVKDKRERDVR